MPAARILALAALLAAPGAHAMPTLTGGDVTGAEHARSTLVEALATLRTKPTPAALEKARAAMRTLERSLDHYFHAANLRAPATRPLALALRQQIHLALGGADAVLVLHDDVFHFRPAVHRVLADASRALGDRDAEIVHLRTAIALAGPDSERLGALRAAYLALGDQRGAAAAARALAKLGN